ncbi:MAG: carbohydrate ABC transporter permease, partial [Oscillibacter sp.]|nr:carbohydrate ABC transporter permease [Oscillibacter sp.]
YITVARSFFASLPGELIESARIDGASEFRIFGQLVLPLSKPVIAVLGLYYSVSFWNSYFPALLYLGKKELQPLSLYVRSVVIQNSLTGLAGEGMEVTAAQMLSALQLKYAVVLVAVLPMLVIYPFLSKNLEKGLMIGAVKA